VTTSNSSSSFHSSAEHMATICCARISRGDSWNDEPVKLALLDGAHQRSAFHQFVTRGRKEAAFGNGAAPVSGTPKAL